MTKTKGDDSVSGERRQTLSLSKAREQRAAEKTGREFARFTSEVVGILRTIRSEAEGDSTLKQLSNAIVGQLNRLRSLKGGAVDPENPHAAEEVVDKIFDLVERADQALHRDLNPHKIHEITPGRFHFDMTSGEEVRFNAWGFDVEEGIFSDALFKNAVAIDPMTNNLETRYFRVERRGEVDTESYTIIPQRGFCGTVMVYTGSDFTQVNFSCMHNDHLDGTALSGARLELTSDPEKVKQDLRLVPRTPERPERGNKAA